MYNKKEIEIIERKLEPIDDDTIIENFESMLDDCNEVIKIGNLSYMPSRVLKEVDPIAYDCGLSDYIDSDETIVEVNGNNYWLNEIDGLDFSELQEDDNDKEHDLNKGN